MSLTYREVGPDDVEALVRLRLAMQRELGHSLDGGPLESALREYFHGTVSSGEFFACVADLHGEVVACSGMVIDRHPPSRGNIDGRVAYIMNMYTVPEQRGRGIATALLARLIDRARALGLKRAVLHGMPHGRGIYRRAGFLDGDSEMRLNL